MGYIEWLINVNVLESKINSRELSFGGGKIVLIKSLCLTASLSVVLADSWSETSLHS